MTGALFANSNWDDDKGTRDNVLENLNEGMDNAIARVYGMKSEEEQEMHEIPDTPFFKAMYRGLEKQHGTAKPSQQEMEADMERHMGKGGNSADQFGDVEIDQ